MSNRTTAAYESVFDYIHRNILSLDVSAIITDFERALRNALRATAVATTKLLGCWFHHCQALRRKVASISELFELVKREKEARILYRTFQCLALLPAEKIKSAFEVLGFEALKKYPQFEKFIRYYDKQWIEREKPENYSVFLEVSLKTLFAKRLKSETICRYKTIGGRLQSLKFYIYLSLFK